MSLDSEISSALATSTRLGTLGIVVPLSIRERVDLWMRVRSANWARSPRVSPAREKSREYGIGSRPEPEQWEHGRGGVEGARRELGAPGRSPFGSGTTAN
jgi:hypothetical protein